MNININSFIHYFIKVFKIFAVIFILNTALFLYLPKIGIEENANKDDNLSFYQINLSNTLIDGTTKRVIQKKVRKIQEVNNLVLTAIYSVNNSKDGWVTVALKNNINKTNILSVNEVFKGYKLKEVYFNKAIFVKNNKSYEVYLNKKNNIRKVFKYKEELDYSKPLGVSKKYINKYVRNFSEIWKSISIKEVLNKKNQIDGFKILSIQKKSPFSTLGLKRGDIIKKVNNTILDSYADAFKIYKNISNVDNLQITILRGNRTMEINYEIN